MKPSTPLKWKIVNARTLTHLCGPSGQRIASFGWDSQDASYIVHACNHYAELVAALRACIDAAHHDIAEDMSAVSNAADAARAILKQIGEEI